MLTATGAAGAILPHAADSTPPAGPEWWAQVSPVFLAAAGLWATWAQFIYPKLVERRARRNDADADAGTSSPPPAPPVDLVGGMVADQARRLDAVLDDLEAAHRKHARDAGAIARALAERDEARRRVCPDPQQHHRDRSATR